jgi:hypothetical protein
MLNYNSSFSTQSEFFLVPKEVWMAKTKKVELRPSSQFKVGPKFDIFFTQSEFFLVSKKAWMVWGDFPSLYFRFYKVIMHGSANATNEGKNTNVILEIKLRL